MRNPWVHDDAPNAAESGYGGRVKLLAALVWGTLFVGVSGFVLLGGSATLESTLAESTSTIVTSLVAAVALVLGLPVLLKLLAISRLLATLAFLGSGWALGRFLWAREGDRFGSVTAASETLDEAVETVERLSEGVSGIEPVVDLLGIVLLSL